MLLADVVATSTAVAATRSRTAKAGTIAELLRAATADEAEPVTAWLAGEPRQGRLGVGWRTLSKLGREPSPVPSLTVAAVDHTLTELTSTIGYGSAARRDAIIGALLSAATTDERGSGFGRNSSSRSPWTAPSAVAATRAASRCGSPGCCGTGRTRPRPTPTPSTRCAPCFPPRDDSSPGRFGPRSGWVTLTRTPRAGGAHGAGGGHRQQRQARQGGGSPT